MAEAPQCVGSDFRYPRVTLADGSTRRTSATSTGNYPDCIMESAKIVSSVFDSVQILVSKLIVTTGGRDISYEEEGSPISLTSAPHKDHIHVYERDPSQVLDNHRHHDTMSQGGDYLVPYHVDNGIFLLITPFPNHGMNLEMSDGSVVSTDDIGRGSIIVLFGLGLTDWLLQNDRVAASEFHPVPHAVPALRTLRHRSVFARMVVAPATATPAGGSLTFDEVFMRRSLNESGYDSQVCSTDLLGNSGSDGSWRDAMDAMCDEGEAYCWMGCRALPRACPAPGLATCFSKKNNLTCSTEPNGKPMDPACKWECLPSSDNDRSAYKVSEYCNGKMDMLMLGFDVSGKKENPCIVLFVEEWTLDTPVKFWLACFGVMCLGFSIEALIALRRTITRRRSSRLSFRSPGTKSFIPSKIPTCQILTFLFHRKMALMFLEHTRHK